MGNQGLKDGKPHEQPSNGTISAHVVFEHIKTSALLRTHQDGIKANQMINRLNHAKRGWTVLLAANT